MIKERVMYVLEIKGIAKENFFRQIGMQSSNFRGNAAKTPLNSKTLAEILRVLPDISPDWLLTGQGNMLRVSPEQEQVIQPPPLTMEDKLIDLIDRRDRKIEEQAQQIGALKKENELLKKMYGQDAGVAGSANAV